MKQTHLSPCIASRDTIIYISGKAVLGEHARIEKHIAECEECRKTISSLTRLALTEESGEESSLIESIYARTFEAASSLWQFHQPLTDSSPRSATRRGNSRKGTKLTRNEHR